MKRTIWNQFSLGSFALAALLTAACGQPPGGTNDGDGGTDHPPPPARRSLSGTAELLFRDNAGVVTRKPIDLHADFFSAHFVNADGSWRDVPGVGNGDGTYEIAEAGDGQYWLRIFDASSAQDQYVLTDRDSMALDFDAPGRADVKAAESESTVVLLDQLTGLDPWQDMDSLSYVSANLGIALSPPAFASTGDTTLTAPLPWSRRPLADASRGDDLLLVQNRHAYDDSGTFGYTSPIRSLSVTDVTQKDGEINRLKGTFTQAPAYDYPLHWKRSAFAALQSSIHPVYAGPAIAQSFASVAMPGGADRGPLLKDLPPVVGPDFDALVGFDDLNLTLPIHKAYPESWWVNSYVVHFEVDVPVPGDPSHPPQPLDASVGVILAGAPDPSKPVEPMISPARDLKINGNSLWADQEKVGLTPTVSWSAPATGTVSAYVITLAEWEGIEQGVGGLIERAVLMVPGDVTEVRLPPQVLRPGQKYLLNLRAIHAEGADVRAHGLYQQHLPYAWADTYSNTFSP